MRSEGLYRYFYRMLGPAGNGFFTGLLYDFFNTTSGYFLIVLAK